MTEQQIVMQDTSHRRSKTKHMKMINWLRAAVLGAEDGIVSLAGLLLGVIGATTSTGVILAAGIAGIIAGAISMAAGEYVSVSSSRDVEKSLLEKERYKLANHPEEELQALAEIYEEKGLKKSTAMAVAKELTVHDAMAAHFDAKLGIDPDSLTNPWHAAFASALSFFVGSIIPLVATLLPPVPMRAPVAFTAVIIALIVTGVVSAKVSETNVKRVTVRVVLGGILAMVVTYSIGRIFAVTGL